ncbi:MAG: thiamine pyrophosphate-dependent dehydrogenase E1 component subunit alpha [Candidatus Marinimicrobia bacterium]|nr:thiamine pyrophosphate-dependent dehydrogenase E1 component subunit alpha [Candidatus Neomarinimicrobiota bacterium]MCF7828404.1 thiamine pyrophosphate-dependent dehydrogenase E1 component subunit alpha [Candidatus Neomarinimicrobiota bacterium]MCF7881002.1 thiamine pyrophosphate-dependent dehydrogenase E1 component subunit alpha [Candidatus Neomarinimicrobiota bacterium]
MNRSEVKSFLSQFKSKNSEIPEIPILETIDYLAMYYYMQLTRTFELRLANLYRQGQMVGGLYLGTGNEATSVGATYALQDKDILAPMHRDLGAHFVKGESLKRMALQYLGRAEGPTAGKDNGAHHGNPEINTLGMISHLGAMIPVASGAALASKIRKMGQVALHFIGDGSTSIGDFHEGINAASVLDLPVVYIIENNQYAYSTPNAKQFHTHWLAKRAVGYGIPGVVVDGTDATEMYRVTKWAVERARNGDGPVLIESQTMRMRGHSEHDAAKYVPEEMMQKWEMHDPVPKYAEKLAAWEIMTENIKEAIDEKIESEMEAAFEYALEAPAPEGPEAKEGVFAE